MVERYVEVTNEYVKQLEQEIDNLKKINEEHKEINGKLQQENKQLKEVIDKAIEYIKSYKTDYSLYELSDYNVRQILKILKGDNNE